MVLDSGALGQAGAGNVARTDHNKIASAVDNSFPLKIIDGGTSGVNQTSAFNNLAPLTSKGDLIVFNGTDHIRLSKGSDGQTIVYNSGVTGGIRVSNVVTAGREVWKAVFPADSPYSAVAGDSLIITTKATSGVQVNLPSSPSQGDKVQFIDGAANFDTKGLTVGRNTKNIMGSAVNLTVDNKNAYFGLVYRTSNTDWRLSP